MSTVIEVAGLTKSFGPTQALAGLELMVQQGDVHGFLGPNGAGKSTTIKILLGLMRANAGRVRLLDGDPWDDAVTLHRRIAYVPGDVDLWPNLTGGEAVDMIGRLRGGLDVRRRDELVERFELDPRKKCRTYSTGNRQKVALIAALSTGAELLVLDEPTSGLDPLMELVFQQVVQEAVGDGATVLLSSHILAEVEKLADRVTIIRQGRTVQSGSLGELRHLTRSTVDARTRTPSTGWGEVPGVADVVVDGEHVLFTVDGDRTDAAMQHLAKFGTTALTVQPPSLEELMLRHYQGAGDE
ncbi:ABC transporter ATP-binding protein [Promicromonospora panici]|uniref:ABC transporter ATP-binding protein n=1 Tax=Promicromonospora panici TaxID=2219658 RepID=UPI00101C8D0B|nr:ABC transporter ATP-binding protein [Promicromonospora panici]